MQSCPERTCIVVIPLVGGFHHQFVRGVNGSQQSAGQLSSGGSRFNKICQATAQTQQSRQCCGCWRLCLRPHTSRLRQSSGCRTGSSEVGFRLLHRHRAEPPKHTRRKRLFCGVYARNPQRGLSAIGQERGEQGRVFTVAGRRRAALRGRPCQWRRPIAPTSSGRPAPH